MKKWYLIAYDIRHPKRLRRIHYLLSKHGLAMQYSVFLLQMKANKLDEILSEIRQRVNTDEDDVRLYPIAHPAAIWTAGEQGNKVKDLYPQPDIKTAGIWSRISGLLMGKKKSYVIGD